MAFLIVEHLQSITKVYLPLLFDAKRVKMYDPIHAQSASIFQSVSRFVTVASSAGVDTSAWPSGDQVATGLNDAIRTIALS